MKTKIKEINYLLTLLRIIRTRGGNSFPALLEIQTINRCNALCPMCPYSHTIANMPLVKINGKLYSRILNELSKEKAFGTLVLSFQNEPLMDKELVKKAKEFKKIMPDKNLEIVTNGTLLNKENIPLLYNYFDRISISINAYFKSTYDKIMNGKYYDPLMRNLEIISQNKAWINKTMLRFVKQKDNYKEFNEFKRYWNNRGFSVFGFDVNTRVGSLKSYDSVKIPLTISKKVKMAFLKIISKFIVKNCYIPLLSFYIRSNGDVVPCFNDYSNDNILGNVNKTSIRNIYNSPRYKKIREKAKNTSEPSHDICKKCDLYHDAIWLAV